MENFHQLERRVEELESRVAHLEGVKPFTPYQAAAPAPAHHASEASHNKTESAISFENFIGGRVLLRAGVIAILLAVGFFLKYAFDQELLSDIFKVMVIAVFGAVMIGIGEYFARKHPVFGHVIAGGGIAMWFFDVVAARILYDFLSATAALIITVLLTGLMLLYSVKRESQPILIAALGGAYLAPLLYNSTGGQISLEFAVYTGVITLGAMWFLQRKTEWIMYLLFPILGFCVQMLVWIGNDLSVVTAAVVTCVQLAVSLCFVTRVWHKLTATDGITAVYIVQAITTFVTALLIEGQASELQEWVAPVLLTASAAVIAGCGWWLYTKKATAFAIDVAGLTTLIFTAVSAGLYFEGRWIVYAWLLLTIVAASVAALISRTVIAVGALVLSFTALMKFLGSDQVMDWGLAPSTLNDIVLLFVFMILVFWFQAWLAQFHKEVAARSLRIGAFVLAEITGALFLIRQIGVSFTDGQAKDIFYSIGLILYGVANVVIGFFRESRAFRVAGLVVLGIAIFKVSFVDLWGLGTLYRIAVSLVLGILLVASSLLYHRYADKTRV